MKGFIMRDDILIDESIIYDNIRKEKEKEYQPLQLEIPIYERNNTELEKKEDKEPRRVIIIDL